MATCQGGEYLPVANQAMGNWIGFPKGAVHEGKGGSVTLKLADSLITTRWVRIVMTQSSNQPGPHGSDDVRHRVGYASYEVDLGRFEADGKFADFVKHAPDGREQTATYCSSTDPRHTAEDLSPYGDQTGWDLFFTSGITNDLPALITLPLIYSVPEDAAAMTAYLKKRGYPISWVEMDEEADGQYSMPEDYAALYIQFADAIHKVEPTLKLGGPVFQGINQDVSVWPDAHGNKSWFGRFYDYLKAHHRQDDLTFASFEVYPYDACTIKWEDLYRNRELTRKTLQALRDELPFYSAHEHEKQSQRFTFGLHVGYFFGPMACRQCRQLLRRGRWALHSFAHRAQRHRAWLPRLGNLGQRPLGPRWQDHWLYGFLLRQPDDQGRVGDASQRYPRASFGRCRNRGRCWECSGHELCGSASRRPVGLAAHQQR
jgi:hypothetical protein